MSHNTTIDEVLFTDIEALKASVKDLNKMGVECELIEKAVPRAYSKGQLPEAPYVLKLKNSQYDVGFYYNNDKRGYEAKTDFYAGHINNQLGAPVGKGETTAHGHMGKLFRTYAVQATTRQAVREGYTVRRVDKADGGVQLIMTGMRG